MNSNRGCSTPNGQEGTFQATCLATGIFPVYLSKNLFYIVYSMLLFVPRNNEQNEVFYSFHPMLTFSFHFSGVTYSCI